MSDERKCSYCGANRGISYEPCDCPENQNATLRAEVERLKVALDGQQRSHRYAREHTENWQAKYEKERDDWLLKNATLTNLLKRANGYLLEMNVSHHSMGWKAEFMKLQTEITATLEGKPTRDAERLFREAEGVLEKLAGAYGRVRPYVPCAKDTDAPVGWLAETMQITYGDLRKAATLLAKIRQTEIAAVIGKEGE